MCDLQTAEELSKRNEDAILIEAKRQQVISDVLEAFGDDSISPEMAEALGVTVISCNGSFASVDIGGIPGILIR